MSMLYKPLGSPCCSKCW